MHQDVKKQSWAIKVDLSESVEDFHQRIPSMAHKVEGREGGGEREWGREKGGRVILSFLSVSI